MRAQRFFRVLWRINALLFQKNRQYYLALFDKATLTKKSEREIAVPALR